MAGESTREVWKPFLGSEPTTLALPDFYANYFAYGYDWKKHPDVGLRITGEFGNARYMSYNLYDEKTGASLGSLTDVDIVPAEGSVNPFVAGNPPDAANRQYVVDVFCADGDKGTSPSAGPSNALTFADGSVTILVVMLRYYLPDGGPEAGVPLPAIEAFDTRSGESVDLPANLAPARMPGQLYQQRMEPVFGTIVDDTLRFYHVEGGGQFNNKDNLYLINAVEKQPDEVLILSFRAPGYAHDNSQNATADVRYWSFNQGNADTSTPTGTADKDFKVARDGRTYVVMGDASDESIRSWARRGGYNFMPWEATSAQAVILYRNLVTSPSFAGSIANVPKIPLPVSGPDDPSIVGCDAVNSIREYAPTGKKVTRAEFMESYGGIPSPGFADGG